MFKEYRQHGRTFAWLRFAAWAVGVALAIYAATLYDPGTAAQLLFIGGPTLLWVKGLQLRNASGRLRVYDDRLEWRRWGSVHRFPFQDSVLSATDTLEDDEPRWTLEYAEHHVVLGPEWQDFNDLQAVLLQNIRLAQPHEASRISADQALDRGLTFKTPLSLRLIMGLGAFFLLGLAACGFWVAPSTNYPWILAMISLIPLCFGLVCAWVTWHAFQRITLEHEGLTEYRLWRRRRIRFADVTRAVWENTLAGRLFTVRTERLHIRIEKELLHHSELITLVREHVPQSALDAHVSFPYTLTTARSTFYGGTVFAVICFVFFGALAYFGGEGFLERSVIMAIALAGPLLVVWLLLRGPRRWVFDHDRIAIYRGLKYQEFPTEGLRALRMKETRSRGEVSSRDVILEFEDGRTLDIPDGFAKTTAEELYHALRTLYGPRLAPERILLHANEPR